jgi:flagellar secretion chaperone FliS
MALADMFFDYPSSPAHGRSPLQIVVMLYDNALASMKAGKAAIVAGDSHRRDFQIDRSEQIMTALMHCLDTRSGEMAVDLRTLYCYVLNELSEARGDTTTSRLERCEVVLKDLRNVWLELEAAITPESGFGSAIAA